MGPRWKGCKDHPIPSMSPGIRPHSCPRAPCTGRVQSVILCTFGQGAVASHHHLSRLPVTRTVATKWVSGAQLSCSRTGRVALLAAGPHLSWCLLSVRSHKPGKALCSLSRELLAHSVLQSPTYTQGSFLFKADACHGMSWGRKNNPGAILGLARTPQ